MPSASWSGSGKTVDEALDPAHHAGFSGGGIKRFLGQRDQRIGVKTGGQPLQPQRGHLPVAIAARSPQQIGLAQDAGDKCLAQLDKYLQIRTCRGSDSRIESACFVSHGTTLRTIWLNWGLSPARLWYPDVMTGGTRIVPIDAGAAESMPAATENPSAAEAAGMAAPDPWIVEEAEAPAPLARPWLAIAAGAALLALVAAWSVLFALAYQAEIVAGGSPAQWVGWIGDWAVPVLLAAVTWLVLLRGSRREVRRFGDAARVLHDESLRLETRLVTVNRELSLAREFIAAQSRDLESLGRIAAERLSQNADRLAELISTNGARLDTIDTVSATALDNMEKLRGQLPVIASSAKDVTNNIGAAGRTAHAQIEEMVQGFNKLNQFGQASERQVQSLRALVDNTLAEFARQAEQLDGIATQRFAALAERGAEFRTQLDAHEIAALAAIRTRAGALSAELDQARALLDSHEAESLTSLRARLVSVRDESAALTRALREGEEAALEAWGRATGQLEQDLQGALARVAEIDEQALQSARERLAAMTGEADAVDARMAERDHAFNADLTRRQGEIEAMQAAFCEALAGHLAGLDAAIAKRRNEQEVQSGRLVAHADELSSQLSGFAARMAEIADHGGAAEAAIAASLSTLTTRLLASREALAGTDASVTALTDSSVRLLELIQASAKQTGEDLPAAMGHTEARLAELETRAIALRDVVEVANHKGAGLSDYVIRSREDLAATLGEVDALHAGIAERTGEQARGLAELKTSLAGIRDESLGLAEQAQAELRQAIGELGDAARAAVAGIETFSAAAISALAERLGVESGAAIDKAMRMRAAEATGQLEQAAAHAAGVSREAAIQLRDQLAKVNDLAANLERRVAHARERAEEQVDGDFARRVALITEALNSNAIDIARALDTDVTDTAWASYLRGDRGVFTRRAVKLLDNPEARAVAAIYESDRDFRDHVSRYIHDFEAMLRQLLSTRDGHALGVTLLSSDMGKLYVALAQAIERLRN